MTRSKSKYRAVKIEVDGMTFHSKKEAARYGELKILLKLQKISLLGIQPRFPLVVNGKKIGTYIADFEYYEPLPEDTKKFVKVVEDVKGYDGGTPVYKLKKKLVAALYGITIRES